MTEAAKTLDSGLLTYASANLPRYTSYPTRAAFHAVE